MATLKLNSSFLRPLLATVVALAIAQPLLADDTAESADQKPSAKALSAFSCVLAGSETQFGYELTHVDAARVRVDWTLLVDRQPIGRGVVVPDVVNAKGARTIAIPLTIPSVRPGVVLSAT